MERYFHNEHDDDDDMHNFDEFEDVHGFIESSHQKDIMDVMQIELSEQELNERLLIFAEKMASETWFWGFRSIHYKLTQIDKVYKDFKRIISED
jgi:hypothetical protein